ncbi:MAG: hypothetical protein ABJA74_02740 [Lapillicoccus sp.]
MLDAIGLVDRVAEAARDDDPWAAAEALGEAVADGADELAAVGDTGSGEALAALLEHLHRSCASTRPEPSARRPSSRRRSPASLRWSRLAVSPAPWPRPPSRRMQRALTITHSRPDEAAAASSEGPGHHYLPVPLWGPCIPAADAWPLRVAVRRAMRRILTRTKVDVLHLRMADVASWAAAEAARDVGVPVVLTLAPDPHASVASREADGSLTRATFGATD